jgi:predicted nucleic acid-binding protein
MEAHRRAVHKVVDREKVWEELASCAVTVMKLRREERRLKESRHLSMSVDKVLYFAALLTAVALKYITDPAERAKFAEQARLLAGGHPVEIDDELLAAVPFGNLRFGRN